MKAIHLIAICLVAGSISAQTKVSKTVPIQKGQKVKVHFDYPGVTVNTWSGNEILIQGTVSINNGENDNAFQLHTSTDGNTISIRSEIKDLESLPHRVVVMNDGEKMIFRNKTEWQKYKDEHGKNFHSMSQGVDMDIKLEIKIPHNIETQVECIYGLVEIKDFTGPLTVKATYGGIDASLKESSMGELNAETNYGHIYTNLDVKFNKNNTRDEAFHTYVSVKTGVGPRYSFSSPYGNVYLRKRD